MLRIIKPATVRRWAARHADATASLDRWITLVEDAEWNNLVELRTVIPSADEVTVQSGRTVVVFNIGGNKYRLVAAVHYNNQIVYALLFPTHAEYDRNRWKKAI